MPRLQTIKGILRTLFWLTREEWGEMDHKIYRIVAGLAIFILAGLFWFYFIRSVLPMPFHF